MVLKTIFAGLLFMSLPCLAERATGWIFQSGDCQGLGNAVVRFTPPKDSNNPIVVTDTDSSGAFIADLPTTGEYYLGVYFGTKQIYGRVVNITSKPLFVTLHTSDSKDSKPDQECIRLSEQNFNFPVAITGGKSGGIYILDVDSFGATGKVLIVRHEFPEPVVRFKFQLPERNVRAFDLVSSIIHGKEYFFISEGIEERGIVQQFSSADGRLQKTWHFSDPSAGLAIDPDRAVLYVALNNSHSIARINLDTGKSSEIIQIIDSRRSEIRLGPMAVDTINEKIYVADQTYGLLYQIDLQRRTYHEMKDHVGQATGLAFNSDKQLLFITDGGRSVRIFSPQAMRVSLFAQQRAFRHLSGVTVGDGNTIWLADRDAHALFHLSAEGDILTRWP